MHNDYAKEKLRDTLLVIVLGFALLYVIFDRSWMLYVSIGVGITGTISLKVNQWIHLAWFFIAEKLGFVMNKVVLGILYTVILIPFALLSQIFRKDNLSIKTNRKFDYITRDHHYTPEDMEELW